MAKLEGLAAMSSQWLHTSPIFHLSPTFQDYTPPKTPPLQRLHPSKDSTPPKIPPLQRLHPSRLHPSKDSTYPYTNVYLRCTLGIWCWLWDFCLFFRWWYHCCTIFHRSFDSLLQHALVFVTELQAKDTSVNTKKLSLDLFCLYVSNLTTVAQTRYPPFLQALISCQLINYTLSPHSFSQPTDTPRHLPYTLSHTHI